MCNDLHCTPKGPTEMLPEKTSPEMPDEVGSGN